MKVIHIALKDTLIRFRDRNGLLLMLAAPLVLAIIAGAAFGGLSGGGGSASPITDIPLAVVNADRGDLGQRMASALLAETGELAELLAPVALSDLAAAQAQVERGELRAVVFIPADFSAAVMNQAGAATAIKLYTDPTSPFSALIVRSIVSQIASRFNAGSIAGRISAEQLLAQGAIQRIAVQQLPAAISETIEARASQPQTTIEIADGTAGEADVRGGSPRPFNALAYFAPSMAILFLMFTIFEASRSILAEEREWTLQRMVSTPTRFGEILAGKIGGVFLTGVLQLAVLIAASALLFRLNWGHSLGGLALLVIGTVAAAASLGAFITAVARDAAQAGVIGSAVALVFAILGGNFIESSAYPAWLQPLSRLTINRWALDGFTDLSLRGGGFNDVAPEIAVLFGIAALLFALAAWRLPRRFVR